MIGVDTLQVNLSAFDVVPGHSLTVRPSNFSPTTGEVYGDFKLWQGQHGAAAFFNDPRKRFFVDVRPFRGGHVGASVHLSLPKYATGGRDNVKLLPGEAAGEVLNDLQRELDLIGVRTNLEEAQLSRVDLTRNVQADETFATYRPVLQLVEGKRLKDRREYVDGYMWSNSAQQVCAYDKIQQLTAQKLDTGNLRNVFRFEYRMRDARKCRDVLGFGNVRSLIDEHGSLAEVYRSKLKEQVFRFQPSELEVLTVGRMKDELSYFAAAKGRRWLMAWVEARGMLEVVKLAPVESVLKLIEEMTGDRKKAYRMGLKLRSAIADSKFLQRDMASQKTYRTLYGELRSKVLAA